LALNLLHNARYLDAFGDYAPLLSRAEQFALDLTVLARDDCAGSHALAGDALSWGLREGEWEPAWPALRELAPELSDVQLAKALGRIYPEPTVRKFLLATLADSSQDVAVRLAAASALTRDIDPAALAALTAAEAELNKGANGAGTQLLQLAQRRTEMAAKGDAYDAHEDPGASKAKRKAKEQQMAAELVELYAACPVAALAEREQAWGLTTLWAVEEIDLSAPALVRWQDAMVDLSGRLSEFDQPWNTHSDLAWRLDRLLRTDWAPPDDGEETFFLEDEPTDEEMDRAYGGRLGVGNWRRIRDNVDSHLARRAAGP